MECSWYCWACTSSSCSGAWPRSSRLRKNSDSSRFWEGTSFTGYGKTHESLHNRGRAALQGRVSCFESSWALAGCGKNSVLPLILGGATLQRCDNCTVLNAALAAEGTVLARVRLFPRPLSPGGRYNPKCESSNRGVDGLQQRGFGERLFDERDSLIESLSLRNQLSRVTRHVDDVNGRVRVS